MLVAERMTRPPRRPQPRRPVERQAARRPGPASPRGPAPRWRAGRASSSTRSSGSRVARAHRGGGRQRRRENAEIRAERRAASPTASAGATPRSPRRRCASRSGRARWRAAAQGTRRARGEGERAHLRALEADRDLRGGGGVAAAARPAQPRQGPPRRCLPTEEARGVGAQARGEPAIGARRRALGGGGAPRRRRAAGARTAAAAVAASAAHPDRTRRAAGAAPPSTRARHTGLEARPLKCALCEQEFDQLVGVTFLKAVAEQRAKFGDDELLRWCGRGRDVESASLCTFCCQFFQENWKD